MNSAKPAPPDGGYGWVIVAVAVTFNILGYSTLGTYGVLFEEFMETFNISKTVTSFYSLCTAIAFSLLGILIGPLVAQFGYRALSFVMSMFCFVGYFTSYFVTDYRLLYITYGLIPGISWAGFVLLGGVVTQQYFDKRRGIAGGIVSAGVGIALLIWPIFTRLAVDAYGWRGTLLLTSGIMLHGLPLSILLRPFPSTNKTTKSIKKKSALRTCLSSYELKTVCTPHVSLLLLGMFIYILAHLGPFALVAVKATANGMTKYEGAILLMIQGFSTGVGRFFVGMIGDFKCVNRIVLLALCFFGAGIATMASYCMNTFPLSVIYCVIYGLMAAGISSLQFSVTVDLVGIEKAPSTVGFQFVLNGMSQMACVPLAGYIADKTNINVAFVTLGVIEVIAGFVILSILIVLRGTMCKSRTETEKIDEDKVNI